MFNKIKYKSHLYKLLFKQIIKVHPSTNISLIHIILKKKYLVTTGQEKFYQLKFNVMYLNKPFFAVVVTKKPKSYPFKIIKT